MKSQKFQIYLEDLMTKGLGYFIVSRLKKHAITRKLVHLIHPDYVLVERHRLFINKMDTVVSDTLLSTGTWEPFVASLFIKLAKKTQTIVDIGGNIGYFTLLSALHAQPKAKIFTFEPDTTNFKLLEKTIGENKLFNTTIEQRAVAQKSGQIRLFVDTNNFGDHRTYDSGDNRKSTPVKTTSLDDYFYSLSIDLDLIKMDIQGFEYFALLGAKQLLKAKRIKIILSELWPMGLQLAGCDWQEVIKLLKQSGFSLWEIDEENKSVGKYRIRNTEQKIMNDASYSTSILAVLK